MTNLPRLELVEDPNKNNEFIIFRKQSKGKKMITFKKVLSNKSKNISNKKKTKKIKKKNKSKSIFSIF